MPVDLQEELNAFTKERKFNRKGSLCVALVTTQHARTKAPCCTDQPSRRLWPSSAEDHARDRGFAAAGQDCTALKRPRVANRAEQSQMGGRYRTHNPRDVRRAIQGQCRSPSSHPQAAGSGNELA